MKFTSLAVMIGCSLCLTAEGKSKKEKIQVEYIEAAPVTSYVTEEWAPLVIEVPNKLDHQQDEYKLKHTKKEAHIKKLVQKKHEEVIVHHDHSSKQQMHSAEVHPVSYVLEVPAKLVAVHEEVNQHPESHHSFQQISHHDQYYQTSHHAHPEYLESYHHARPISKESYVVPHSHSDHYSDKYVPVAKYSKGATYVEVKQSNPRYAPVHCGKQCQLRALTSGSSYDVVRRV